MIFWLINIIDKNDNQKPLFLAFYCWSNSFLSQERPGPCNSIVSDHHACHVHNVSKYFWSTAGNSISKVHWCLAYILLTGPFCCFHHPSLHENGKTRQRSKEANKEWKIEEKKTKNCWRQGLHKKICSIPCAFWYHSLCVLLCFSCSLFL